MRWNTTHAGDNNTAAACNRTEDAILKRPVHGTDWREEQSRSVKFVLPAIRLTAFS
jgi:hypothetical protein